MGQGADDAADLVGQGVLSHLRDQVVEGIIHLEEAASRTELRATPIEAASSGSGGMRSPGLSALLRIASVRQLMTRCTTDSFFKFFT